MGQAGRWLSAGAAHVSSWLHSFTIDEMANGAQMLLGWALLLAIYAVPAVWDQLSLWGVSPTTALVLFGMYQQPRQGASLLVLVLVVAGALVASVEGFIPTYLAYAANGGSYAGAGAAKAATLVAAGAVLAAAGMLARGTMVLGATVFQVAGVLLAVRLYGTYWMPTATGFEPVPVPPNSNAYYSLLSVALPGVVALPLLWLVFPAPAGRQARAATCRMLRSLGQLSCGVVDLMLAQPDQPAVEPQDPDQQQQQLAGGDPAPTAPPPDLAASLHGADAAIRADAISMGQLLPLCLLEVDVYGKQRRLPAKAYKEAVQLASASDSTLSLMLRWLAGRPRHATAAAGSAAQHGAGAGTTKPGEHLDTSILQAGQVARKLRAVQAALGALCNALAAAVEQSAPFDQALEALQQLESSWQPFSSALAAAGATEDAAVVAAMLRAILFLAASKVRDMVPHLAAAVEGAQPGAQAATASHFAAARWGATAEPASTALLAAEQESLREAAEAGGAGLKEAGALGKPDDLDSGSTHSRHSSQGDGALASGAIAGVLGTDAACTPPAQPGAAAVGATLAQDASSRGSPAQAVVRPSAALEALPGSAVWRSLERRGIGLPQLLPMLHMLVLFAACGVLVVVKAAFVGLGGRSLWVAFTVNAAFEKTSGRIRQCAIYRVLGTAASVSWSCMVIGLAQAVTGGTYDNSPAKYAVMAVLVSLFGGLVGVNRIRHPNLSNAWTIMMIVVPVVVLEGFKGTDPWALAKWRIVCVCIGVGMDLLVTSCMFPVTTATLMRQQALQALADLADLAEGVAASQAVPLPTAPSTAQASAAVVAGKLEAGAALEAAAAGAAVRRAELQALAQRAKSHVLKFAGYSLDAASGPLPLPSSLRRQEAAVVIQDLLMQLCDSLVLVTLADEALGGQAAAAMPADQRRLVLAVGAQIGESLRCLRHVIWRRLPMAAALRTLPALDALLCQLAAAAGQDMAQLLREQQGSGGKAAEGDLPSQAGTPSSLIMPFTAAALGTAATLRSLYTLAVAGSDRDEAAAQAAEAELQAGQAGVATIAAAQRAALASSAASYGTA